MRKFTVNNIPTISKKGGDLIKIFTLTDIKESLKTGNPIRIQSNALCGGKSEE